VSLPDLDQPFVVGSVKTEIGPVPQISSSLTWKDRWGAIKARWGVDRMHYAVEPGLYALGNPDTESPVLVSANYTLSFDRLRETLTGRNVWILVLDTEGINVWCAAGKGTFGTAELVRRIIMSSLTTIVHHRNIILPQLAGPGVAAHMVKKHSGFNVHYGPIRARDLEAYLEAGLTATPEMRLKTFNLRERIVLIPVELVEALKAALIILPVMFFLGGLGGPNGYWTNALQYGTFAALAVLSAVLIGTILTPILLPFLPGRPFALKGLWLGLLTACILIIVRQPDMISWSGKFESIAWLLLVPAMTAYLAMNFTGASTFTSLSGVKKEMRWAVPLEIGAGLTGFILWLGSRFIA
jgi:hypothetical protein